MARAIILVLDSLGIGATPDADRFGDHGADTLGHIAEACARGEANNDQRQGPLHIPHLASLGLFHAHALATERPIPDSVELDSRAAWGAARELSSGKDTPSGHWEIAGVPMFTEFGYFRERENSFPPELLQALIKRAELPGLLGNCHASGTEIIDRFGPEHVATGKPIVYTSADSVFQIAAHEAHFGLDRLLELCQSARELLMPYNIGRVIARPFTGDAQHGFRRTGNRRDYSLPPPAPTLLERMVEAGGDVLAVGKIGDIYAHRGISRLFKADGNEALFDATLQALEQAGDNSLVMSNFVDFDMLHGHRRDTAGYALALERFDQRLPALLEQLRPDDLLILSADHGCDPTFPGSDHTREHVPVLALGPRSPNGSLGIRASFADIGQSLADFLGLPPFVDGQSFLTVEADLLSRLHELRQHAYAPYSGFTVAAVAQGASGQAHGGCNVEAAHYKSICAEAAAIAAMVAAGEQTLEAIYILGPEGRPLTPCGDCRQRIAEHASPDCRIHLVGERGERWGSYRMEQLLPAAFDRTSLGQ
jgi:phosphopentomutase